ncbi:17576_t:CDS:1 [Acaulospora morrowiae]|uniref:17576_t:CDS:1 n=1 Tax=Acaulospora morrowiae TaxID=94023 RepID=A0A9N8ZI77_9GLOM|nr:17576_t:CDS:1 [Acaulospora morrowiae]
MKPNYPSNLASKRTRFFFLLILAFISQIKAGSLFQMCLGNVYNRYDKFLAFANNTVDKELMCCTACSLECVAAHVCPPASYGCGVFDYGFFQAECNRIGKGTFCITTGYSNGPTVVPGSICGGILGNTLPVNALLGSCPDLDAVRKTINGPKTSQNFTWMCCGSDSCSVPSNVLVNVDKKVASTNCAYGQYSMMCFYDNGGWSCTGSVSTNIDDITIPMGDCVMQIASPDIETISSSATSPVAATATSISLVKKATITGIGNNNPTSTNSKSSSDRANTIAIVFGIISSTLTILGLYLV